MRRVIIHKPQNRIEHDANLRFGFYFSILRSEQIDTKKVVPFQIYILLNFWTWEQEIEILLPASKVEVM